jgi:DNA mismatch repair protein MutS2
MLKAFAHETPAVSNASMEFDHETLKPTYVFRSGIPGSSYALDLAKRLELPKEIIEHARELVGEEKVKLEQLLADLERQSQEYRQQLRQVSTERDELDSLVRAYDEKMRDLRKELGSIRRKAVDEAQDIVRGAQALIEKTIKEIRESAAEKATVRAAREDVEKLQKRMAEMEVPEQQGEKFEVRVGDTVRFRDASQVGEVIEIKGPIATVLSGTTKVRASVQNLVRVEGPNELAYSSSGTLYTPEGKTEIDVRGLLGEEAISRVEKFLDDAVVAGFHRVDVIHGKGTGALRKRIGEFLKTYPHVRSYRLGEWNEGGAGVTVVELD